MEHDDSKDENTSRESAFNASSFLSLSIGIPFCLFKFLFGVLAIRAASVHELNFLIVIGWLAIIWSVIDLLMNLFCVTLNLLGKNASIQYCLIAQVGQLFKRPSLFLGIDTFLSFSIICFVLWSGWIKDLSQFEAYVWYAATTVNLISLSVVNIWTEFKINSDKNNHPKTEG